MKSLSGTTKMKPVNPMGTKMNGGDGVPTSDMLQLNGKKAGAKKISSVKGVLLDGPYGGKAPQS
jgi:hypothetical protein